MKNYNKSIFSSKAEVLKELQGKIKQSKIEKLYFFTVNDWKKDKERIIEKIKEIFSSKIVVRSSALGEDSIESSYAGVFESVLDVEPTSKKIKSAVEKVINSFYKKNNYNKKNQILVQTQSTKITTSGVIFSKTNENGAPYYVINFEEGGSTIGVTQGQVNESIKIFRDFEINNLEKKWIKLVESIRELESILKINYLDVEFGISKSHKIIIFQVRPMTSISKNKMKNNSKKVKKLIANNKKKFCKFNQHIKKNDEINIFSDMSDWNPAEIIGQNPNLLDYSLYDYLIMKNIWYYGRINIGYQKVKMKKLMIKFGNKPYVNIKASFGSMIPKKIKNKLKTKLLNFYVNKLIKNPHFHDKVEFEILFTCFDLSTKNRLKELKNFNFSSKEIIEIEQSLIEFTNEIINKFPSISDNCSNSIQTMLKNREKIFITLNKSKRTSIDLLKASESLLKDCKKFGTLPFSTMARISFIASSLLKSLLNEKYMSKREFDEFLNSIRSPLSEFQNDLTEYSENKLSKKEFLKKYGHLRPGTYDINAKRYEKEHSFLNNVNFIKENKNKEKNLDKTRYKEIFEKNNLKFLNIDFFSFVEYALVQREKLKFEFTRNLSDALELIAEAGEKLGFKRKEIANLDIKYILDYKKNKQNELQMFWRKQIKNEMKRKEINNYMILPPLITSKKDFELIRYYSAKPNFITSKRVTGELGFLKNSFNSDKLKNKIFVIENADPGYDWIFSFEPIGLITKYGGVASHMAIRCSELGLPAAIGCGDVFYEKLIHSSKILLDCKNEKIIILENIKNDDYIEERKILKSLGYIV